MFEYNLRLKALITIKTLLTYFENIKTARHLIYEKNTETFLIVSAK